MDYVIQQGLIPCLEFSAAESAYVKDVANIRFVGSNAGYYDNRCAACFSLCSPKRVPTKPTEWAWASRVGCYLAGTLSRLHAVSYWSPGCSKVEVCRLIGPAELVRHLGDRLAGVSPYRLGLVPCCNPVR